RPQQHLRHRPLGEARPAAARGARRAGQHAVQPDQLLDPAPLPPGVRTGGGHGQRGRRRHRARPAPRRHRSGGAGLRRPRPDGAAGLGAPRGGGAGGARAHRLRAGRGGRRGPGHRGTDRGGAAPAARGAGPRRAARPGGAGVSAGPLRTALTDLVGCRHPVVQTGMGWVAGPRLVSATANAGGLGVLASATMPIDRLAAAIREVRERTDQPFGVNLRADAGDAEDRVELLIAERVRVASFALAPRPELIARLKEAGVVVIPSVGARRHAEKVAAWGADAVLVQGGEGGGHTGPLATTLLLPQVVDAVEVPVIAAGGFFDGRGLAAALAYGAAGVAMGTRFLLTSDSPVPDEVKRAYLEAAET